MKFPNGKIVHKWKPFHWDFDEKKAFSYGEPDYEHKDQSVIKAVSRIFGLSDV